MRILTIFGSLVLIFAFAATALPFESHFKEDHMDHCESRSWWSGICYEYEEGYVSDTQT